MTEIKKIMYGHIVNLNNYVQRERLSDLKSLLAVSKKEVTLKNLKTMSQWT